MRLVSRLIRSIKSSAIAAVLCQTSTRAHRSPCHTHKRVGQAFLPATGVTICLRKQQLFWSAVTTKGRHRFHATQVLVDAENESGLFFFVNLVFMNANDVLEAALGLINHFGGE